MAKKTHLFKYKEEIDKFLNDSDCIDLTQEPLKIWYFIQEKDYSNKKYQIDLENKVLKECDRNFWKKEKKNYKGIEITEIRMILNIPNLYEATVCRKYVRKLFKQHLPSLPLKKDIFMECENKYIKCLFKRKSSFLKYSGKTVKRCISPISLVINSVMYVAFAIETENRETESTGATEGVRVEVENSENV